MKKVVAVTVAAGAICAFGARKVSLECDTLDLGEYRAYAKLAKELGATHLAACQIEPSMWQWDVNRYDPYPNWSMHRATIFKFVVPEELKPYLPADYAARNLALLKERVKVLDEFGLKATFTGMEPAYLPEKAYRDHPNWRGPRCDQSSRARNEYYAPCTDDPEMRALLVKGVTMLCKEVPFEHFELMCNDSGSGLCWFPRLYAGPNGPDRCRFGAIADRIVNYLSIFQEGAKAAGIEATVNFNRYVTKVILDQTLPKLKPGQALENRTPGKKVATAIVGFPNPFAEHTYPIWSMPRVAKVVEQLQAAERNPSGNVSVTIRSLDEEDMIRLMRMYFGKKVGPTRIDAEVALAKLAATFVGEEKADRLVRVWTAIEDFDRQFDCFQTGGHVFLLGTTHQRWLTRPLVPFPAELKPEEKDYYRAYQFQAREEKNADDLLDLQAHRWLGGYGGRFAFRSTCNRFWGPVDAATATARDLVASAKDGASRSYLEALVLKLRLYRAVAKNALDVIDYQFHLDEALKNQPKVCRTEQVNNQGDVQWYEFNEITRSEIDNTLEIVAILDEAEAKGCRVIRTAARDAFTNVMNLPPVPRLVGELRKKVEIMENHRRDVNRLYNIYNN